MKKQILFKKFQFILILAFLAVFFWSCASRSKKITELPPQASSPTVQEAAPLETPPTTEQQTAPTREKVKASPVKLLPEPETAEEVVSDEPEDQGGLLEEALAAYQDSQDAWEKGDVDSALAALDEAYRLLLELKIPPDSPLNQDKNDLRLLIAQRIQEIYASQLLAVGENHMSIPLVENQYVLAEIKSFQTKERKYFEESYARSGLYREMIVKEIKKTGLPEELSWIPIIESGFKVKAYSSARALGLWQFISSTGYRFGLKRDRWVDERMDPVKATQAALQYLQELHSFFGDWTTALAAYNCGEFRVQRVIRDQHINYLDNFWDLFLMLPRETARFVPRFIATLLIINNPDKYGFNLPETDPSLEYESVSIDRPVKLSELSTRIGLEAETLGTLNPDLRYGATPDHEYDLKIPVGYSENALAAVNSASQWIPPEATYVVHYVRRGETVSGIADHYRTSVSAIARLNNLRRNYLIRPGQRLKVPARGGSSLKSSQSYQLTPEGEKLVYTVQRGDSLYLIARSFNTTVNTIKKMNNLQNSIIHVGQKLEIVSENAEGSAIYTVRSGDTPFEIAQRHGMKLETLLRINGLNKRSKIYPGQKLLVASNR